ncbi:MAG: VOC family protein [Acidimicrobiales bacterium]|mgnify:FL=1|nr:VOC family protein [Acidimicrobiales bacterium]MDP6901774.1 VOC family protein [Acidimicrobiales bacterium]HJL98185.1 VOC family protein [Acidimicrobiales bacterium]
MLDLHHVHIFASDVSTTVEWWQSNLGAVVSYDGEFGGSRNIFMKVGRGRINVYDQQPRGVSSGAYHHVGIRVEGLAELRDRMAVNGVEFRSDIREFGNWRYLMCTAPDGVLLELFEVDIDEMPSELAEFFNLG